MCTLKQKGLAGTDQLCAVCASQHRPGMAGTEIGPGPELCEMTRTHTQLGKDHQDIRV